MIDKESLLNDKELLKSFKDGLELQSFFRELQTRAVSQMLEGEMDGHLGYEKHERSGQGNSRNGHTSKKVRGIGFLFSSLFILGSFATTVASMFPTLLPSTNAVNPSLTIQNAAAHEYGLTVGLGWFIFAAILVIAYFIIQFSVFKGKLDDVGYGEH